MARLAGARCILVGDIDRGGVFASLFGTLALLEPSERDLIDGFVINKFRGDIRLLSDGISSFEERVGKPCLGVVPYIEDLRLDEEDSVSIEHPESKPWLADNSSNRLLRVAIIRFPSISNFTDFDPLIAEPSVDARFCRTAEEVATADLVILPGSKQTVADLRWMHDAGIDEVVRLQAERGLVVGICGGMQMLGTAIDDPYGVKGGGTLDGLGLLSIRTKMNCEKTTREATGELMFRDSSARNCRLPLCRGTRSMLGKQNTFKTRLRLPEFTGPGSRKNSPSTGVSPSTDALLAPTCTGSFMMMGSGMPSSPRPGPHQGFLRRTRSSIGKSFAKTNSSDWLVLSPVVDLKRMLGFVGLAWPAVPVQEGACASAL